MAEDSNYDEDQDFDEIFEQVKFLLNQISNDMSVPRNIRKIGQESIETIDSVGTSDDNTPAVCASTCITLLEDVAQDLNCPLHTRTQIYQIMALLEQIRD